MAWDPAHEVTLLFGGDTERGPTNDLEAWDGAAWSLLASDGPPARNDAILVADPARGVVVLFGGRTSGHVFTDTWEWDGSAWHELDVQGPPARVHAAAAYDPTAKRVIVHGGAAAGDVTLRDTWAWDGTAWTRLDEAGIPDRVPSGMAWDATLEQVVVLAVDLSADDGSGLYPSEVWGWSGKGWERIGDGPPPFSPLQSFVSGPGHPLFVDGGAVQGELTARTWTGDAWDPAATAAAAGPDPRNGQAAAFDAEREELVVFGGFLGDRTFGDTWLLADGTWRELPR
jgi:hypothetical protein